MKRLIIIVVLGIAGILFTAWVTKPMELPPDVIIIRPLPAEDNPYQKEYDEMLSPTVMVETLTGRGSGVVIDVTKVTTVTRVTGCYILTAAHVVGNYAKVSVTFYSYVNTVQSILCELSASVVITDSNKDLALLKITNPPAPASPFDPILGLPIIGCPRNEVERGKGGNKGIYPAKLAERTYTYYLFSPVYVVGCSLGLNPRPSSGIISAINFDSVEITAPVLPGNSGGGVFAKRTDVPSPDGNPTTYELIGIAVWVRLYGDQLVTTMAGIVPIGEIYRFLDEADKLISKHVDKEEIVFHLSSY
jgi:hypothetical protein